MMQNDLAYQAENLPNNTPTQYIWALFSLSMTASLSGMERAERIKLQKDLLG